jgi:hypothetical protein
MSKRVPTTTQISELDSVKQQFTTWRSTKVGRERIPILLWQAAVALVFAGGFSLNKIARNLSLSHSDLKKHVYKQPSSSIQSTPEPSPAFIEIEPPPSFPECVIEMEDGSGTKMRMCFRGKADSGLIELGKYFLRDPA